MNAGAILIGQGPYAIIIEGLTDIVSTANVTISQQPGTPSITDQAYADIVYNPFRKFVHVNRELFKTLSDKTGLFIAGTPVLLNQRMAPVLRQVQGAYDTLAIFLIDTVQPRSGDLASEADSLRDSLRTCVRKYGGISLNKRDGAVIDAARPDARVFVA
ncbi:hypothetical protein B0I37DRAFT_358687 [Chaetomium sp. MPI-CAGE-AT-0009]|nr:hypothetical protein B0I37DRAFT_358687 [Chaetomium sp. MPI-CAGE-AT-0009]